MQNGHLHRHAIEGLAFDHRARAVEVAKTYASFEPRFGIEQEYTFFQ